MDEQGASWSSSGGSMTETAFVHGWRGLALPSGEAVMEAQAIAVARGKAAAKQGTPRLREQKGTALVRADIRAFGVFRRLDLLLKRRRAMQHEEMKRSAKKDEEKDEAMPAEESVPDRHAKEEEDELTEGERVRAFDPQCGWRSAEMNCARYLYLHRFVGQATLHAQLAVCVLADAPAGLLGQFVRSEAEPLEEAAREQLLCDYRRCFKQWVLDRVRQM